MAMVEGVGCAKRCSCTTSKYATRLDTAKNLQKVFCKVFTKLTTCRKAGPRHGHKCRCHCVCR